MEDLGETVSHDARSSPRSGGSRSDGRRATRMTPRLASHAVALAPRGRGHARGCWGSARGYRRRSRIPRWHPICTACG